MNDGTDRKVWAIWLALALAVVAPTACVLWFMTQAMRNERLAVRQKLAEAYQGRLNDGQQALNRWWKQTTSEVSGAGDATTSPSDVFAQLSLGDICDSVVVVSPEGAYPQSSNEARAGVPGGSSHQPRALESVRSDPAAIASEYGELARDGRSPDETARALHAEARALAQDRRSSESLATFSRLVRDPELRDARDAEGRFIVPTAQLLLLQRGQGAGDLVARCNEYSSSTLPSAQRRFLMREVAASLGDTPSRRFATFDAEEIAATWLEREGGRLPENPPEERLTRSGDLWACAVRGNATTASLRVALFGERRLLSQMQEVLARDVKLRGATLDLAPPDVPRSSPDAAEPLLTAPAADALPGWRLAVRLDGENPFATAARRQALVYLWTGLLAIAALALAALLAARYLMRQMRLTRLKNDLIATVSHELKTPLASMRVLVDTLLEGRCRDEAQRLDYLRMMAKENARLTRTIENFLTFSRMERNKRVFDFAPTKIEDIVREAADTVRERFDVAGVRFEIEVAPDLPEIRADRDALVTVLLNLLDNAFKYTRKEKHIVLRAGRSCNQARFEVEDNGIGIPRRAQKRIFERFYQVDQRLSRPAEGCGLGLSIARFVVQAHGGAISFESRPEEGSRFVVTLPLERNTR